MRAVKLALVGGFAGAHLAGSLSRAAEAMGIAAVGFDSGEAEGGGRLARALRWRLADRRPARAQDFTARVASGCEAAGVEMLIATGSAAMDARAIKGIRGMGVRCVNFSSDDPWNPALKADWHLRALPHYDVVFTPRQANVGDLVRLGCRRVEYLPFGYDDALFGPRASDAGAPVHDVLFVGGADRDRAAFMRAFMTSGPSVALAGGYWRSYPATRAQALGQQPPDEIRAMTAAAKVNLCLVRRANRDGHVMRSLEIAGIGGTMLVEDTADHRRFFGDDGQCVAYFRTAREAAERANALVSDDGERTRLSSALRARMAGAHHTYRDRLQQMLKIAAVER